MLESSVDMVLCDLPYGVTRNKWDSEIDLEKLWRQYKRIVKPNGAIVLFGQGLFSAKLVLSNPKMYRYSLVWDKVLTTGFLNANKMPLRSHEDIHVFYGKQPMYNPQKLLGKPCHSRGKALGKMANEVTDNRNYGDHAILPTNGNMKFPTSILKFEKPHPSTIDHPTQKPISLCEYLIKTYTNTGDIILDNCMGSGTTGVAALSLGRNFFGIELDNHYFDVARNRIDSAVALSTLYG